MFLTGGIATAADTRAALNAGADCVIAGTQFLMTHEANAHPEYQRRILDAESALETTLFGLSWPLRHRVIPNAATRRWCRSDGTAKALPAAFNASSRWLSVLGYLDAGPLIRVQSPRLPIFAPLAPLAVTAPGALTTGLCQAGCTSPASVCADSSPYWMLCNSA